MSWNTIIFGGMFILSLFIFINLSKVKASKKQLDRSDKINRFGDKKSESDIKIIRDIDENK
jgi:hypothetical protein